ncbi:MAG: DNA translocase FtsK 4TM domain-containing protein [Patescibacteria group bacterium]|jgi:S-DNA-T family DNA segregation ATPase FtsK/SpoIIIE
MARRKKHVEDEETGLSLEVRRSIVAVVIIAVGAVAMLSVFGFAGNVGKQIDDVLAMGLGLGRVVIPLLLIILGMGMVAEKLNILKPRMLLALVVFLVSFSGLVNLFFASGISDPRVLKNAGGALGLIFSNLLVNSMGLGASIVIALACFLVSLLLMVNKPLVMFRELYEKLFPVVEDEPKFVGDDIPEEEEMPAEEGEEIEDGGGEEATEPEINEKAAAYFASTKAGGNSGETVMTSAARRKIEIPLDLLDNKRSEAKAGDIERNQEIIVRTMEQFGIPVEMSDVRVGPTVTQYAFRPAQGVKLARVVALQNDLALALAAHPIRIEAPIPGKALVGVEVPNLTVARVGLRELLESKEFRTHKSSFAVPLGKDISGATMMLAVDKAPHMLVAGATGSGKSVCLNDIIISLLYQNGPDDLKFIMVDPKRVELGVYTGIPHLLVPPIVKAEEAVNALKWAIREMERRLDYLAKFGARDIDSYNAKAAERMPRIIIVIDELADLMIQNKRDVEAVIVRLAQMARAAGIHLVLATQRPSVDVITGTIKANIPTRLAFAVASQVDSKTILDTAGADKLLGRGDMLISTPDLSKPRRAQGAYVSDEEIERVVAFLKKESVPDYNYQIIEGGKGGDSGGVSINSEDADELLEDAIHIAIDAERVSTSYLQRRMKIGYSRAARIVDLMEEIGVVGPADGAKPREVLVSEWPPAGTGVNTDLSGAPIAEQGEISTSADEDEEDEDADVENLAEEEEDETAKG